MLVSNVAEVCGDVNKAAVAAIDSGENGDKGVATGGRSFDAESVSLGEEVVGPTRVVILLLGSRKAD